MEYRRAFSLKRCHAISQLAEADHPRASDVLVSAAVEIVCHGQHMTDGADPT